MKREFGGRGTQRSLFSLKTDVCVCVSCVKNNHSLPQTVGWPVCLRWKYPNNFMNPGGWRRLIFLQCPRDGDAFLRVLMFNEENNPTKWLPVGEGPSLAHTAAVLDTDAKTFFSKKISCIYFDQRKIPAFFPKQHLQECLHPSFEPLFLSITLSTFYPSLSPVCLPFLFSSHSAPWLWKRVRLFKRWKKEHSSTKSCLVNSLGVYAAAHVNKANTIRGIRRLYLSVLLCVCVWGGGE